MRFGCCLNMVASGRDKTGIEAIGILAKAGYDYAELPLAEMMAIDERAFDSLAEEIVKSGICCEVCNNFFPETMRLTGIKANIDDGVRYADKALSRAAALGVEVVVFGSGRAKTVPRGYPLEAGYAQIVRLLKEINICAGKQKITVAIEPLRKRECNLINTYAEACRLADDVKGKYVKVLVDYYHLTEEKEPLCHVLQGKEYLHHVHFANPKGRIFPVNPFEGGYADFFSMLRDCGYDGRISCEAYTESFGESAVKTLEFFRRLTEQGGILK